MIKTLITIAALGLVLAHPYWAKTQGMLLVEKARSALQEHNIQIESFQAMLDSAVKGSSSH